MNWEAVGAVGELIAAAGVIISLLYLAGQVRSNSRQLRHSAAASVNNKLSLFLQSLASTDGMADIWVRGLDGFAGLRNDEERTRFAVMLLDTFPDV